MKKLIYIIKSLRPKQWIKNGFVFAALIFAGEFTNFHAVIYTFITFFLFSFTASSVYLINDCLDYEADKNHPIKKNRPIASGKVGKTFASILSLLLFITSLTVAFFITPKLSLILSIYVLANIFYSLKLKHVVIIDIMMISFFYVLRAIGGAAANELPISPWFLIIIFLLTLYLSVMKRRQEFVEIEKNGGKKRKVLEHYSIEMLDQMSNTLIPAVLVSYTFFTFNSFHTHLFMLTVPIVIFGFFRYTYLVYKKDLGENPTDTLVKDIPLLLTVFLWGVLCMILIYFYN